MKHSLFNAATWALDAVKSGLLALGINFTATSANAVLGKDPMLNPVTNSVHFFII